MTQVQAPNGDVVNFPDAMSDAQIEAVMRREYPAPRPAPATLPRHSDVEGAAAALGQGLTFGFGDEIGGAGGGLYAGGKQLLTDALHGRFDPSAIGAAANRGYQQSRQANLDAVHDFQARRPFVGHFTEGTGAALPMLATAGGSALPAVEQTTARGLPLLAAQTARAGVTGAGYGALYGAGSGDGSLQDRANTANQGALLGALLGSAAPTAVNTIGAIGERALPAIQNLLGFAERHTPLPAPNSAGAMGANLRPPRVPGPAQPPASSRPTIPPAAIGTIERLADRSRMSPTDVEAAFRSAQGNPQGQVVSDIFGDPGVRTTRAIAQAPGQTGERAAQTIRDRFSNAAQRIVSTLQRSLNVGESRTAALARLGDEYQTASNTLYRPVLSQPTTPQMADAFKSQIGDVLMADPVMVDAERRAGRIFQRDQRLGLVNGEVRDNLPRYLHYVKMGLDDAIGAARRDPSGIQATEMRGVMQLRNRFVSAMDDIIPGYREARQQWGGLANAEEALGEGADFVRMQPNEVQARVAQMTPFELHHARIGLADEVRQMTRGAVNRNRNVTIPLDDPDVQQAIAAVYDSPEQAAHFLETVNTQYRLLNNASQWTTGSPTYSNAMHGADEHLQTLTEMGAHTARGNPVAAAGRGAQHVMNMVTGGALERANNQRGEALLTRIDTQEAQAFTREVVRLLRQRQAARAGRGAVASVTSRAAGAQAGRRPQ